MHSIIRLNCIILGLGLMVACSGSKSAVVSNQGLDKLSDPKCLALIKSDKSLDLLSGDLFQIESSGISGNCLKIEISYSGGCGKTEMQLYYNEIVQMNVEAALFLTPKFIDNDPCREIVCDTLLFDLSPFEGIARAGGIEIHISGYEKPLTFALPLH